VLEIPTCTNHLKPAVWVHYGRYCIFIYLFIDQHNALVFLLHRLLLFWFPYFAVRTGFVFCCMIFSRLYTARRGIGCGVVLSSVRPSVCLWRCALWLNDTFYCKSVWISEQEVSHINTFFYKFQPLHLPLAPKAQISHFLNHKPRCHMANSTLSPRLLTYVLTLRQLLLQQTKQASKADFHLKL